MEDRRPEEEPDQIYEEIRSRQEKKSVPLVNKIPRRTRFFLALGIIFYVYYVTKNQVPFQKALLWAAVGVGAFYLLYGNEEEKRELTERECRIMLEKNLHWLRENPIGGEHHIPTEAKIVIATVGRKLWLGNEPWKRQFKVLFRHPDGTEDVYSADVDIYNGDLIGMRERASGYTGAEPVDIKTIAAEELREQRYRDQFLKGKT